MSKEIINGAVVVNLDEEIMIVNKDHYHQGTSGRSLDDIFRQYLGSRVQITIEEIFEVE